MPVAAPTEPSRRRFRLDRVTATVLAVSLAVMAMGAVVIAENFTQRPPPIFLLAYFGFDIPVAICVALALLSVQRQNWLAAVIATLVPVGLIGASSLKLLILGSPALIGDIALLGDLRQTLHPWQRLCIDLSLLALGGLLLVNLRFQPRILLPLMPLALASSLLVGVERVPSFASSAAAWLPLRLSDFPLFGHVVNAMTVRFEEAYLLRMSTDPGASDSAEGMPPLTAPLQHRNIHLLVVESFIDPLWLSGLHWPGEPLSPLFGRWRRETGGTVLVPVFGNRSSNTEFEVLCGLPAMGGSSAVLFLWIREDAALPCLPRLLAERGFRTVSLVPNVPSFFGVGRAFKAMGFERRVFSTGIDMSDKDGIWLSAEATLGHAHRLTEETRALSPPAPVLTYTFINAGHFPYERNLARRPDRLIPTPHDPLIHGWANGAHYNALAIEAHVARIQVEDPDALIIILGDHNPPLGTNFRGYRLSGRIPEAAVSPLHSAIMYETPLLVLDRGRVVPTGRLPAWQLPDLIFDLLSGGMHCQDRNCGHMAERRLRPFLDFVLDVANDGSEERVCFHGAAAISEDDVCRPSLDRAAQLRSMLLRMVRPRGA